MSTEIQESVGDLLSCVELIFTQSLFFYYGSQVCPRSPLRKLLQGFKTKTFCSEVILFFFVLSTIAVLNVVNVIYT